MAENHYDLDYTGSMVDRILDTGYDLQNQGYIFRGLASHYTGTPTERTWLIAPTGSTGFGLSSPVPPGSIGICMYNGSSWSAEVLNTMTLDTAPTTGSGNGITSGAVKTLAESITNAIGQLEQSVSDRFTSMELEDTTGSLQAEVLSITLKYIFEGETEPLTSISILAATAEKAGLMSAADKQKLDSLIDNIRSIRLVDITTSTDKGNQMDLSLKWTVGSTQEIITYITLMAATTGVAGLMSAVDKSKLDSLNIVGCQYAGLATPTTVPLVVDADVFYIAVQGGNYSNFGLTVPEGISILKNEGYGWTIENLVRIDDQPTDGSAGIARSGGTYAMISAEAAARESADATLSAAVVAEHNARIAAIQKEETARKAAIQEEKSAREHADGMMIHEIETFEQGVRDTVAEYKPIVIQGDVQNAPDEVDLTSTPDNLLKFKDNIYNPVLWSGMGRIYLRKNIIPESENYQFDGFVNDVPTEGEFDGEPDAVLWDRINTVFVGKKNDVYYEAWTGCENYVPARQDVIYMYDGTPYVWDGDDFAVDEDVVPNLKNILTEDMMPYGNTIYVIRWDYYLNGDVTVPENCILEFDGGSINGNYTITGQNTGINAELVKIFSSDVILDGTWNAVEAYPEWFGAVGDGVTDCSDAIQRAVDFFNVIRFSCGEFVVTKSIVFDDNKSLVQTYWNSNNFEPVSRRIKGSGKNATIIRNLSGDYAFRFDGNPDDESTTATILGQFNNSIEGLSIFGKNYTGGGIYINSVVGLEIRNVFIKNVDYGVYFSGSNPPDAGTSMNLYIYNTTVLFANYGIVSTKSRVGNLVVDSCVFRYINDTGVKAGGALMHITNSTFAWCGTKTNRNTSAISIITQENASLNRGLTIDGCLFEADYWNDIFIENVHAAHISGCSFHPYWLIDDQSNPELVCINLNGALLNPKQSGESYGIRDITITDNRIQPSNVPQGNTLRYVKVVGWVDGVFLGPYSALADSHFGQLIFVDRLIVRNFRNTGNPICTKLSMSGLSALGNPLTKDTLYLVNNKVVVDETVYGGIEFERNTQLNGNNVPQGSIYNSSYIMGIPYNGYFRIHIKLKLNDSTQEKRYIISWGNNENETVTTTSDYFEHYELRFLEKGNIVALYVMNKGKNPIGFADDEIAISLEEII